MFLKSSKIKSKLTHFALQTSQPCPINSIDELNELLLLVVDVDRADAVLDVPGDVPHDARVHRHHGGAPVGGARELAEHAVRRRDVLAYSEAQFNIKNIGSSYGL